MEPPVQRSVYGALYAEGVGVWSPMYRMSLYGPPCKVTLRKILYSWGEFLCGAPCTGGGCTGDSTQEFPQLYSIFRKKESSIVNKMNPKLQIYLLLLFIIYYYYY